MSQQLVTAYIRIKNRIAEQSAVLKDLRREETMIVNEITDYLNQTDEIGLRIDQSHALAVTDGSKKLSRSQKAYKEYLQEIFRDSSATNDPNLIDRIIAGKIKDTVKQQKLKIIKIR